MNGTFLWSRFAWLLAMVAPCALATAPYSEPPIEIWKRLPKGEVIYAAGNGRHLTDLCIEVAGNASWIPADLLNDITVPKLENINIVHGMGLSRVSEFVPDWGSWGLSVEVESLVEIDDEFKEGPTYYFVLQGQKVVHRVLHQWLPAADKPDTSTLDEQWTPVNQKAVRHSPCRPRT